jgi:ribosomal protein L34E
LAKILTRQQKIGGGNMQNQFENKQSTMGACIVCGKPTPKRDIRDTKPVFCGRIHAALAKFGTRYRGTNSGPLDRPTTQGLFQKTKWEDK